MYKEYREDLPFEVNKEGCVRNKFTKRPYKLSLRKEYYVASTTLSNKRRVKVSVHRMVATCFVTNPDPETKDQVNHKDGNKLNNNSSNLEWVTATENRHHAFATGLQKPCYGETCSSVVLTEEQARLVCKLLEQGLRNKDIETITGVSRWQIKDIKRGAAWQLVGREYNLKVNDRPRMSKATVEWVCYRILEGLSNEDIASLSNNPAVTKESVEKIRQKETYISITNKFNF